MTREERAIQILKQRACCMECVVSNYNCEECDEAFDIAIKALEQEPILDKIRAEILNFKEKCNASDYLGCGILEIIDKYKAESEDNE